MALNDWLNHCQKTTAGVVLQISFNNIVQLHKNWSLFSKTLQCYHAFSWATITGIQGMWMMDPSVNLVTLLFFRGWVLAWSGWCNPISDVFTRALCYSCRMFLVPSNQYLLGTFWGWLMGRHCGLSLMGAETACPDWQLETLDFFTGWRPNQQCKSTERTTKNIHELIIQNWLT